MARGDAEAFDELVPLVYDELRGLARRHLRGEAEGHTLGPTALVHEAYLRLIGVHDTAFDDRTHFLSFASRVMRRVLVDHARARRTAKRGAGGVPVPLDAVVVGHLDFDLDVLALDEALGRLERLDPRACRVVECRVLAGLTVDETARALGVSAPTVKRAFAFGRAWLNRELS